MNRYVVDINIEKKIASYISREQHRSVANPTLPCLSPPSPLKIHLHISMIKKSLFLGGFPDGVARVSRQPASIPIPRQWWLC